MKTSRNPSTSVLGRSMSTSQLTTTREEHLPPIIKINNSNYNTPKHNLKSPQKSEERLQDHRRTNSEVNFDSKYSNRDTADIVKVLHIRSGSDLSNLLLPGRQTSNVSPTGIKLGPGYYNTAISTLSGPSFQFSTCSRFSNRDLYLFLPTVTRSLEDENFKKEKAKEIIADNKNMQKYVPENRLKTLREKAVVESTKIVNHIQKKNEILVRKKYEKTMNFESKQRRFEYKIKKEEIFKIFKAWVLVDTICGWSFAIHRKFVFRKDLHLRSQAVLLRLLVLCIACGKFKRLLRKIKIRRAKRTFNRIQAPALHWINQKKSNYRTQIVDLCEKAISKEVMFNLMASFVRKTVYLQRTMRAVMISRHNSLTIKRLLWNKVEYKMYIEHCVKKHTLPKSDLDKRISFQAIQGHSSIPDPVKNHYIKKYLKIRREKYQIEISDYQKECQTAQQEYDKNLYKRQASAVLKDGKVEELKFPLRPTPDYVFSEFEFKKMINEAIQMRGEWENIKKNLN